LVYSVLSVAYNLWLYIRIFSGTLHVGFSVSYLDLSKFELLVLLPLIFTNFIFCFFPSFLINSLIPFFVLLI
jgi:NADH:ubiquinone oxidoreductase subunit 4 (subunit M)